MLLWILPPQIAEAQDVIPGAMPQPQSSPQPLREKDVQPRASQTILTPEQRPSQFGFPVRFYGNISVLPQVLLEVVDLPEPSEPTQA